MKFLIVGDLHGQMPKIHFKEFDAIIAPGDFCSDKMKPLIFQAMRERRKDPTYTLRWFDLAGKEKAHAMTEESLAEMDERFSNILFRRLPLCFFDVRTSFVQIENCEVDWHKQP